MLIKSWQLKVKKCFYSHSITFSLGSLSYGLDLAILSMCNHSVVDYGTFGLWAALLAGGRIILPTGYSKTPTPDDLWWKTANMENVEFINITDLT